MTPSPPRTLRFLLERWIQRGVLGQLLLIAALIGLVALAGGLAAWVLTERFAHPGEAVWWAFLRLTDPGYLGDDAGVVLRIVSTVVTVLGYVLFMGSLIAIMTQGLARTIRRLESGLTPIAMRDHLVVLGWTNRTAEVVLKVLSAQGRLDRFLDLLGVSRPNVVVLSEEVDASRRQELRDHLRERWDERRIHLRSGSSLQPEHLERLDLARAAVVVIPGADFELGGAELTDTRVIKTLLTLEFLWRGLPLDERPTVVAEVFDPLKISIARATVRSGLEVIASDGVVGRVISQSARHHRLAQVYLQLLSHRQGSSLYVRAFPDLTGASPVALNPLFPRAVVLGAVRRGPEGWSTHLNPPADFLLEGGDLLVFLAPTYDDCEPTGLVPPPPPPLVPRRPPARVPEAIQRILVLGWSHKITAIISELADCAAERFEVTIASRTPVAERERWLERAGWDRERVRLRQVECDYTLRPQLVKLDPGRFDDVLFLASSWMESSEEADARTVLGFVLLKDLLAGAVDPPEILVELLDPENSRLFPPTDDVILVSPRILSHLLAHVALRPELNSVFDALLGAGGAELEARRAREYGLQDRSVSFSEIQARANASGGVALGILRAARGGDAIVLAPSADTMFELGPEDELVVLADYAEGGAEAD